MRPKSKENAMCISIDPPGGVIEVITACRCLNNSTLCLYLRNDFDKQRFLLQDHENVKR
jgi:hypothetical protein